VDRRALLVPPASYLAGSLPISGLAARLAAGVDLRRVGTGTVSGTALYQVAGFRPLAVAGCLELAKGALGPALAGPRRPGLAAAALALALTGHNWSPWLRGAGGRGVAPALGGLLLAAPEGAALLAAGLGLGRLLRQTGLLVGLAALALPAWLARRRGTPGVLLGLAVAGPMLAKRLAGNRPLPPGPHLPALLRRLLLDQDPPGHDR
jgi:glycerol-3-phosphate acyltransferase PlsY